MAACADAGLLVLTCGRQHEVMRWIPPLDVTAAEIAEAVEIFGETLASIPRELSGRMARARTPSGLASTRSGARRLAAWSQRFCDRNFMTSSSRNRRSPRLHTR